MEIAMIHCRNLAILSEKGNRAMDKLDASVVALEGGAITRAKKLSDRFFPKLGDTAQTGVEWKSPHLS